MKFFVHRRVPILSFFLPLLLLILSVFSAAQAPANDLCINATLLTSSTTPCAGSTAGTLKTATATPGVPGACGNVSSADVWYKFVAQTAYPTITLNPVGASLSAANPKIQLLSGVCAGPWASLACANSPLNTAVTPGGAGLTVGSTYLIRITTTTNTGVPAGNGWTFSICITDPAPGKFDYSKSYVNLSKGTNGGTIDPGDSLEIRATFVVFSGAADSLAFYDTVYRNKGFVMSTTDSITNRTNEGKKYIFFTDAKDADAGWREQTPALDTAITINFGAGATNTARGKLRNISKPSFYTSTCIIMCTYRIRVGAAYGTKINFGGGAITYRDSATGVLSKINFQPDSLIVYQSPGLCPNAVSVTNAVGVETNGTFGTASGPTPLLKNRGVTAYTPTYTYAWFQSANPQGPQDYFYGITNNTSARFSILQNWAKPDVSSPSFRVFNLWDIIGDHTGAANTAKGNPPCDTTKVVSPTNPCGYMLIINSAYRTDTAFQYTVTNICPNTNYEISAWFRNICYKCGCDSNGIGASGAGYIPFATGDSSGVQPNLAFDVDGTDYYTTGNIKYFGTTPTGSDTSNHWVKRGFTILTGAAQSSFTLTIRNNAPGGGGNDWAIDDISVATCLPNMSYSPTLSPIVCMNNVITIYDTVRSYFNNYTNYKWQRSTDGGATWNDIGGATGTASATWNGSAWEYVVSYTIPVANTNLSNNGDQYRLVVATTTPNLSNASCQVTDGVSIINLTVINCGPPLAANLLSFNGKLVNTMAHLSWITSKEDELIHFSIEKSIDAINFSEIGTVTSYNNYNSEKNYYSFIDPVPVSKKMWYRIIVVNNDGKKKYSNVIQLGNEAAEFSVGNIINPFKNELQFEITTTENSEIEVALIDMFGKIIKKNNYIIYAGVNSISIQNTESLSDGSYILQIRRREKIINNKVVKK